MKKYKRTLLPPFAAVTMGAVLLSLPARAEGPSYEKDFQPIVQQFCMPCHDAEHIKGDLDLERFTSLAEIKKEPMIWEGVLEQIEMGEMPPKKKAQSTSQPCQPRQPQITVPMRKAAAEPEELSSLFR